MYEMLVKSKNRHLCPALGELLVNFIFVVNVSFLKAILFFSHNLIFTSFTQSHIVVMV